MTGKTQNTLFRHKEPKCYYYFISPLFPEIKAQDSLVTILTLYCQKWGLPQICFTRLSRSYMSFFLLPPRYQVSLFKFMICKIQVEMRQTIFFYLIC